MQLHSDLSEGVQRIGDKTDVWSWFPFQGSFYQSSLFHSLSVATEVKNCLLHDMVETGL